MGGAITPGFPEDPASRPELTLIAHQTESERVLGRAALNATSPVILRVLNERAAALDPSDHYAIACLVHDTILQPFQRRNIQGGGTENAGLINPAGVKKNLERYFNVFTQWPARIPADKLEAERIRLRTENLSRASQEMNDPYSYKRRELGVLQQLIERFEQERMTDAHQAAEDLLAAYGWTLRSDKQARWKELQRVTDTVHYDLG